MEVFHSIEDFNEAKQVIVGGVNSPVRSFASTNGTPLFIAKGEGAYIIDEDNNAYIDFVQSFGPMILGHAHPVVTAAIHKAVDNGLSFGAPTELETTLAKEIMRDIDGIDKIRLVNSGTEATMTALRLARAYSGKDNILKFDGCYHGHSDALLVSAGSGCATFGTPSSGGVIDDLAKHTFVARYNDIESVKHHVENNDIGTIIIEPIAGNMGLVPSREDFLKELRALCTAKGVVLIFDEVMSGFRASPTGAFGIYGIEADLVCFGKVIGGGMPLAAFGGAEEIMMQLSPVGPVYQAGTLSGNPIATTAGIATLATIRSDKGLYPRLERLASRLTSGMLEMARAHKVPLQASYVGSMFGYFFNEDPVLDFEGAQRSDTKYFAKFHAKMLELGVYFACSTFETGFISAPMDEKMIDEVVEKIDRAFKLI